MARRLAAIMFTDVAGFTAAAQRDESGALRVLQDLQALARPIVEGHHGRRVKSTGDGLLIEFPDALDAVECGVDLQRQMQRRENRNGTPKLRLRVGIHLGDVQDQDSDILGDAVNIASRVELAAEPDGICLSEPVYVQVHNKVPYSLEKLGPRALKGVQEPMTLYRVVLSSPGGDVAARVPSFPRLAVLPFANISPDPTDEYIADGLTEELITILSQLRGLQVTARTSVVQYKGAPKPIAQVAAELGVTAILEGSVRKAGDQLRITVQLIDTSTQAHAWAKTFDRTFGDIFSVQTEVASRIAKALKVRLRAGEASRLADRSVIRSESYLAYLKGRHLLAASLQTEEVVEEARGQFERAVSLDDRNAAAYSGLAECFHIIGVNFHPRTRGEWDAKSGPFVARALELNPNLAEAHASRALLLYDDLKWSEAEKEFQHAIRLSPSYPNARALYASLLMEEARPDEALRELSMAEECDPQSSRYLVWHTYFLVYLRRLDEAETVVERLREVDRGGAMYHNALGFYYAARGDFQRAIQVADRWETLKPGDSWGLRVWTYAAMGEVEKGRRLLRQHEDPSRGNMSWVLAFYYGRLGDLDSCFRYLVKAKEERWINFWGFRNDKTFEPLWSDPRFLEILEWAGLA